MAIAQPLFFLFHGESTPTHFVQHYAFKQHQAGGHHAWSHNKYSYLDVIGGQCGRIRGYQ
jgi:hypothetical protein